jgi:hypothetical protein
VTTRIVAEVPRDLTIYTEREIADLLVPVVSGLGVPQDIA